MISDVLVTMTQVGMLTFIVASMAAMGLGLTIGQIIEPLRDVRMLLLLLAVNFIVVPIVAVAAARLLPMGDDSATAVIIIGCCAGAPFLPKLALLAKGSPALSVGAMVLLMVVTVIYAPIVVPLVVEGAQVDPWDIASSLILFMLVPLGHRPRHQGPLRRPRRQLGRPRRPDLQRCPVARCRGSAVRQLAGHRRRHRQLDLHRYGDRARRWLHSSGYLAGFGRSKSDMTVLGFATAQRNISAALVVAGSLGGNVIVLTLVGALVIPIVLIILAAELGKRAPASSSGTAGDFGLSAADRRFRRRFIGCSSWGWIVPGTAILATHVGVP